MIQALLTYQETDKELRAIEVFLSKSEERRKMAEAKKYLETVPENLARLSARAGELNSAFSSKVALSEKLKEQIEELSQAINSVADEKEVAYLMKKADEIIKQIQSVDGETAQIEEEIKSILKEYSQMRSSSEAFKVQFAEYKDKYAQLKDSKAQEMNALKEKLAQLKKDVDPALMESYEQKRAEKMFPIVFPVTQASDSMFCSGCGMDLPAVTKGKLKNGEVISCDQCRKMLYLAKK